MQLAALLASAAVCWGCASTGGEYQTNILAQVDDVTTGAVETLPAVFELNGQPALLYVSKDNRVTFRYGERVVRLDEGAPVRGGTSYQLHAQGDNLQALWWSHQDAKNLYTTSSTDNGQHFGPVGIVNDDHGVLPFFSVLHSPQGVVGISYLDERKPNYQIYFNRSADYGRTWPKPDQRLDLPPSEGKTSFIRDPQTVESGSVWVSAWVDSAFEAGRTAYRVISRRSEDGGLNWSSPKVIYSADTLVASLKMKSQGGHVVIAGDEHGKGIFAFHSSDHGQSWNGAGTLQDTGFPLSAEGASNSGVAMAIQGDRAHLLWMQDRKGEKTRVMRASYDFTQSRWVASVQRLDIKSIDNTRSISPVIAATPRGALVAAWVDYRDIRPNIYLSASFDQGQIWSQPQPLLQPGEIAAGWPRLMNWRNQIAIAYETYPNDRKVDGRFVLQSLSLSEAATALPTFAAGNSITAEDKQKRLERRVKALWESRVAGNYQSAYEMFDFAYRATTPLKFYLDNVGTISYLSFSTVGTKVEGNEAKVQSKLKYEIKPTMLPSSGKPIKVDPIEVDIENTWVWVGSEWYLVYSPSYDQPILKY